MEAKYSYNDKAVVIVLQFASGNEWKIERHFMDVNNKLSRLNLKNWDIVFDRQMYFMKDGCS